MTFEDFVKERLDRNEWIAATTHEPPKDGLVKEAAYWIVRQWYLQWKEHEAAHL